MGAGQKNQREAACKLRLQGPLRQANEGQENQVTVWKLQAISISDAASVLRELAGILGVGWGWALRIGLTIGF